MTNNHHTITYGKLLEWYASDPNAYDIVTEEIRKEIDKEVIKTIIKTQSKEEDAKK